ncbi:alpha/beta-hydrolase [Byssothecium circinans]|uniref:Alpha/beta-hydrolase n=1 Tax=Byssothecium circinans TaxID=147558 RepID=A0A6A5TQZ0_9PLEO|nr:alpha/beta-hydrolase [Byssothecium circinans]
MDPTPNDEDGPEAIMPYSMHVSSHYLGLTRRKLELTRLPRELDLGEQRRWELGTPKAVLEPLLDFWLETYDWRTQEAHFNTTLPQFRTAIALPSSLSSDGHLDTGQSQSLRIHFVHRRSKHTNAIPLLFCHTWPSSFIEVEKIVDALTDPQSLPSFGGGAQQAFHVVAPSIPGFAFSDASPMEGLGLKETAEAFDGVMKRLGYEHYVAQGTGWGFSICRALALNHSLHCAAVHTVNPSFVEPTLRQSPVAFLKYWLAKFTRARIPVLSFGYTPSEVDSSVERGLEDGATTHSLPYSRDPLGTAFSRLYSHRPRTLAYSLCDSPIGLLAGMLDVIHTRAPSQSLVTSRSRSPFLSPVELEMQEAHNRHSSQSNGSLSDIIEVSEQTLSPRESENKAHVKDYLWSPTEVITFTMMQWLPGPEASLRWLRRAHIDGGPDSPLNSSYCSVPLGISSFRGRNSYSGASPVMWGSASWPVSWVKRHQRPASLAAWEAPDQLVPDMREFFGTVLSQSSFVNLPTPATSLHSPRLRR